MEANPPTRRRWFRFSLRTMLVLVTLVCVYLGWAMNWKRQREVFLRQPGIFSLNNIWPTDFQSSLIRRLPWSLRLVGVTPVTAIHISRGGYETIESAKQLFPEAQVTEVDMREIEQEWQRWRATQD